MYMCTYTWYSNYVILLYSEVVRKQTLCGFYLCTQAMKEVAWYTLFVHACHCIPEWASQLEPAQEIFLIPT